MTGHHIASYVAVMKPSTTSKRSGAQRDPSPEQYEIRVKGHLEPRWATWFGGMHLTPADGITVIEGAVPDQAALHGLLQKLRDIGMPLLSVKRTDQGASKPPNATDQAHPRRRT